MTTFQAIILGLLQGLTEFLPVSSSGHLVLMQNIFGITEGGLTFDILVHFGTLIAIFIVYWQEIISLIKNPFQKMTYLIIIGTVPTALIGFTFKPYFEKLFESVLAVGISLIITGFILWIADHYYGGYKNEKNTSWLDALIIGLAQGVAITPGISRSGITISSGLIRGLDREMAAKYSFLVSIPAIFGANLLEAKEILKTGVQINNNLAYILGPLVAAVSGVIAIKVLLKLLQTGKLKYFSYYVWFLGTIAILQQLLF